MMTCGVYTITNRVTKRVYVGASRTVEARWYQHRCTAKKGSHRSKLLQVDWSRHGEDTFVFAVALVLPANATNDDLRAAEQTMMQQLLDRGTTLYNTIERARRKRATAAPATSVEPMPTIRELREARGWTQAELAERVGTHANTVARWERGDVQPGRQSWLLLARVFRRAPGSITTHDPDERRVRGRPRKPPAPPAA